MLDTLLPMWTGAVWQATVVAALGLVLSMRRAPAALRHSILAVALLKFLSPPFAYVPGGVLAMLPRASETIAPVVNPETGGGGDAGWIPLLFGVYVAGVLLTIGLTVVSAIRIHTLRRRAGAPSGPLRRMADHVARRLALRARVTVAISDDIETPIAVGVFRRFVLLPAALIDRVDRASLRAILAHELAHHRRQHLAWVWIRAAVCAIWWWHPAAWMISRRLRHAQEELCDDDVIRAGVVDRDAYCDVLIRTAAVGTPSAVGLGFGDRRHPLAARVERLLTRRGSARVRPLTMWATTTVLAIALLPGVPADERTSTAVAETPPAGLAQAPREPRRDARATARDAIVDAGDAAASGVIDRIDRAFDRISSAVESVVDPSPESR